MHRRTRLALVALPLFALLGGCGTGQASHGSVRDSVRDNLLANPNVEITEDAAQDAGDCVADALFDSGDFSKDERNEATQASDGERPDPDLVTKVAAVFEACNVDLGGEPG
jgi:hypothetical protein